jgi:Sugar-transfer associated ATP-grasp
MNSSTAALVAGDDGVALKSVAQQRKERRELFLRCFLSRTEYDLYGFARIDRDYSYMLNFLSIHAIRNRFRPILNDNSWKGVLDNKWFFHLHYGGLGFPIPETYGIYLPRSGVSTTGHRLGCKAELRALLEERRPASLVIKPVGGIMGHGLMILSELQYGQDTIAAVTSGGEVLSFDDIAAKLDTPAGVHFRMRSYELHLPGYILQARLQQHPFLNNIAPYTINTVRIVTLLDADNKVRVHFSILRVGRRGSAADNWDRGGISIAIDPVSGSLGTGVLKPKYGSRWIDTHPDSGVRFVGLQLPFWSEVLQLCSRAARVLPNLRSVGWDVAITPDGPVLLEGNPDWDLPMVQVHTDGLLQPDVRQQLAGFGITFPEHTLPPISLREWSTWLTDSRNHGPARRIVRRFETIARIDRRPPAPQARADGD